MNTLITILTLIILVLAIIIFVQKNHCEKVKRESIDIKYYNIANEDKIKELNDDKKKLKYQIEENNKSLNNIKNAIKFYNSIEDKKYFFIEDIDVFKQDNLKDIKQKIAIVFFQKDVCYDIKYLESEGTIYDAIYDLNKHKKSFKLDCKVFVDNDNVGALLLYAIERGKSYATIDSINLLEFTGRGIGPHIMKNLELILLEYGIKKIKAPISCSDFEKREKLRRFYCTINNFQMIREVTKKEWGLATKEI